MGNYGNPERRIIEFKIEVKEQLDEFKSEIKRQINEQIGELKGLVHGYLLDSETVMQNEVEVKLLKQKLSIDFQEYKELYTQLGKTEASNSNIIRLESLIDKFLEILKTQAQNNNVESEKIKGE